MKSFILEHMDEIVAEWEAFARTVSPASATMDSMALRDHVKQMLQAIAKDIETHQTGAEQEEKSKGEAPPAGAADTAAETHGHMRHTAGFDLSELVAEFRALRATVLRIWISKEKYCDPVTAYEITRFNEAIDQALAESVATYSAELTRSRDTFLAILGHDLRSPLSALAGTLHILSNPAGDVHREETLATGKRSVAVMSGMIQDLLEYTRTRLGKGIPITVADDDLEAVCKAAFNEVSLVYPQTAFRFEVESGLRGSFDAARMHQVLANLLNNAVQHGQRGFPVVLVARTSEQSLVLQVKNRGRPIAPELLQVVFDPLVQIPTEDSSELFTNLGLGLFIAREIVLAHGGTIGATSSDEETVFTVELPRHVQRKPQESQPGWAKTLTAANG